MDDFRKRREQTLRERRFARLEAEQEFAEVRGRDLKPYHYGIWCTVGDSEPFANMIVINSWGRDTRTGELCLSLMLDSHNFYFCDPDELVRVVKLKPSEWARKKYADWTGPEDRRNIFGSRKGSLAGDTP